MHENPSKGVDAQSITAQVLGAIARDLPAPRAIMLGKPEPHHLQDMRDTVVQANPRRFADCIARMRRTGVSPATIAEVYVPLLAHRLGDEWVADTLDFRTVSVGSARLQSLLWQLGPQWAQTGVLVSSSRPPVLVAVPRGCQHTLGATVLAGQLRYRGISVELNLAFTAAIPVAGAMPKVYTAVFLSASAREPLENIALLVQKARHAYPATPILLGGNITDQMTDIQKQTGVDLVTCDLEQALAFCGGGASFAAVGQARNLGAGA